MAFSKKHKVEMQAQYASWLEQSQAVFAVSYTSMTVKEIETLRAKARDAGGELHVVKNTLMGVRSLMLVCRKVIFSKALR